MKKKIFNVSTIKNCHGSRLDKFLQSVNYFLNLKLVSITNIKKKNLNFHARFSAKQRIYTYIIFNRISRPSIEKNRGWHIRKKLDINLIRKGSKKLIQSLMKNQNLSN